MALSYRISEHPEESEESSAHGSSESEDGSPVHLEESEESSAHVSSEAEDDFC